MYKLIHIENIEGGSNVRNERDEDLMELAHSIENDGLLQPITVRPIKGGKFEVIAGHRRFEALKIINEPFIECNVLETVTDAERLRLQVIENVHRKNMSAYELVEIFNKLDAAGYTDRAIAELFRKDPSWVSVQRGAVRQLEKEYCDGIPEEAKKLSAAVIKAKAKKRIQKAQEEIECKGMKVKKHGHTYMIYCSDFDAEQELNDFINNKKI